MSACVLEKSNDFSVPNGIRYLILRELLSVERFRPIDKPLNAA